MSDVKYIAVDVEASGPTPARYSILSLGACVVGDTQKRFYRELQPKQSYSHPLREWIPNLFNNEEAMRVGCLGLKCISELKKKKKFNPKRQEFEPREVLKLLLEIGVPPGKAMEEFKDWVLEHSKGKKPILASDCIAFDGMWVHDYFGTQYVGNSGRYSIENPFEYGGVDINSMYRGFAQDMDQGIKQSEFWQGGKLSHNALEDAIQQAEAMQRMLEAMRKR